MLLGLEEGFHSLPLGVQIRDFLVLPGHEDALEGEHEHAGQGELGHPEVKKHSDVTPYCYLYICH